MTEGTARTTAALEASILSRRIAKEARMARQLIEAGWTCISPYTEESIGNAARHLPPEAIKRGSIE